MFELLGAVTGIGLVIFVVVMLIVNGRSSKRPPYGSPGAGMPYYPPGRYPQPGPYAPQGQWSQQPAGYQPQQGYRYPQPNGPQPGQYGHPQQPPGYPPAQ